MSSDGRHGTRKLDTASSPPPDAQTGGDPATRQRILEAALTLIAARGGADVTMAEVARKARVSRQALYLHFADRAQLFTAVVRYCDDQHGLPAANQRVVDAPSGIDGVLEMVAMQARLNPGIWPIARAFEAVRRHDEAARRSWQDRLAHRLQECRAMVARLASEGTLRPGLAEDAAADLLWTLTSLRMWEDLVLHRKWSAREYERRLGEVLLTTLTNTAAAFLQRR